MIANATKPVAGTAVVLTIEPALVGSELAGRLCGLSGRTWQRLAAEGAVPEPVQLGSKRLWSVGLLRRWVALSCPSREQFDELNASSAASSVADRLPRGRGGRRSAIP